MRLRALILPLLVAFLAGADPSADGTGSLTPPTLQPLINRANALLSAGHYADAAKAYSDAIEQSPADYVLYYKRATAYYSTSRHPQALADFQKVLDLTQGTFDKALLLSARIHAKDGAFTLARAALADFNRKVTGSREAAQLAADVQAGEEAAKKAERAKKATLWTACVESASEALAVASHSAELREMRAECAIASGDVELAVGDLTRLTHLTSPSPDLLMHIFRLTYFLTPFSPADPHPAALNTLKQCLRHDPDSKPCKSAHRLVKSLDKSFAKVDSLLAGENWRGVVNHVVGVGAAAEKTYPGAELLKTFEELLAEHFPPASKDALHVEAARASPRRAYLLRAACKAYVGLNRAAAGEAHCSRLLAMDGRAEDVDGLIGMAEAHAAREEWEESVRVLEKAWEAGGRSDRNVMQRLQKAQRLLKQSRAKDYYKVLGVARDADEKTIKRAYRKATLKAHPDKGGSEAQMAAVNEAYEVLSDPELRRRFDNGDDPMDPTSNQGGHPFQQGGNPFGGAGGHPFAQFFQQGGAPGGGSFFGGEGFNFRFQHGGGGRGH
ncbi:DnaJ-domain-containing protein [Punctularia strigosozonata HHB-11173 SS5]|uniref:DnaJ-domain-containing protein n=1 Tax=Punctularia strigosozonata (strain HHB-11173) TaxID=741275 RepID=R7S4T0_PUNST|nr:DnaJ-domain-containing protein [Punctularia strigosozonata HHB-11173 SS5]EIN04261.1 DnaJ-domain-containing protein [Punctularia strigosozonata HHB-11173 SS5]